MVRLKVSLYRETFTGLQDFNSTMVRLKADEGFQWFYDNIFQFHYGTIKRIRAAWEANGLVSFQFHYGTIKSSRKHIGR